MQSLLPVSFRQTLKLKLELKIKHSLLTQNQHLNSTNFILQLYTCICIFCVELHPPQKKKNSPLQL